VQRLKKRADFVHANTGARASRAGFLLQAIRQVEPSGEARVGFTVTKKHGNAVERNRIKRRLRELMRLYGAPLAYADTDYVLIGKRAALSLQFANMQSDLESAMRQVNKRLNRQAGCEA
jgi:ribonuclease P protein component